MGTYLNPANAITASRYLTLPPFLWAIDRGLDQVALLMVLTNALLDLADGPVARKLGCTSGFGELFDAVTDGLSYAFFIVVLTLYGKLPWLPMLLFLGLGGYNALLRYLYTRRVGRATNFRSFAMERVAAYTAYLAGVGVADFDAAFYAWAIPVAMAVICAHDTKRMLLDPIPPESGGAAGEAAAA